MTATLADLDLLAAFVRDNPGDAVAAGVLYDAHQDAGASPLAARRRVNKVIAEGRAVQTLAEAGRLLDRPEVRGAIRRACGVASNMVPITLTHGDAAPAVRGEGPYHTFRSGGICRNPGAAIRAGYKVEYHADERTITVGAGWVVHNHGKGNR